MKPKQFFYLLAGLLVVLVGVGGSGYYLASGQLDQRTQTLKQKLADTEVIDTQIGTLAALSKQYQKVEPALARLDQVLPKTKDESEAVVQMDRLASANGMSLPGITFPASPALPSATSQTEKAGDALTVPVTMQLTGTFDQMESFLQGLEKLNRFNNVTGLSINKAAGKQLQFSLNLNFYMKP